MTELKQQISPAVLKTWFSDSELVSIDPPHALIRVENQTSQDYLKKYIQEKLLQLLTQASGESITSLDYLIEKKDKSRKPNQIELEKVKEATVPLFIEVAELDQAAREANLNPKYRFNTFIVGNRNRLAHAAAQAVADTPGKKYNPLYLYGGVGLGKTHLMQAVGNEIIRKYPDKKVLYAACEHFMNDFTQGIRSGKIDSFKRKYRNVDVFLVDDIQFIAGKEGIQEEFFHTFNTLYQSDRQIIISSDKAPRDIKDLEERLSSRFSSGMIADMQLPDLETRQAILQAKCEEQQVHLPDRVLLFIADLIETNIRELEGALTRVISAYSTNPGEATVDGVRELLHDLSQNQPLKKTSFEQICQTVCDFYGVEWKEIQGQRRQQEIVRPRQVLMYLLKYELNMTFPTIGREIGGRDHTTAMHSVDKIEKEVKKNPETQDEVLRIKELFYGRRLS